MGTTTFSGPVRSGGIKNTTGTTLGTDVKNVGEVVLSQREAITQATNGAVAGVYTTDIVIPANSTITSIQVYVTTVWSGAASTLGIGTSASATALTAAGAVAGGTLGIISATAGADATRVATWYDVGNTDIRIVVTSTNTGAGVGAIVVNYIQHGTYLP
jgi:hypothetical protein